MPFRSGFVSIIGKPNSGKSTLLNALLGEKISIATRKVQTTRHRIRGVLNGPDYQVVFSDTPGIIEPKYGLQKSMMKAMEASLKDADVILLLLDATKKVNDLPLPLRLNPVPVVVVLNKTDKLDTGSEKELLAATQERFPGHAVLGVSALKNKNINKLLKVIVEALPVQPAFFNNDEITDRSQRFLVAELIREKILEQFEKEIPYATEVIITEWKEGKDLLRIRADILTERESQKAILLGKGGAAIRKLGMAARQSVEAFLKQRIFLGLSVKVNAGWRNSDRTLKFLGYET